MRERLAERRQDGFDRQRGSAHFSEDSRIRRGRLRSTARRSLADAVKETLEALRAVMLGKKKPSDQVEGRRKRPLD